MTQVNAPLPCPYTLPGRPSAADGWQRENKIDKQLSYIPLEEAPLFQAGRIQSPLIQLDKQDDIPTFFRLTFKAQCSSSGYWWMDFFDANGNALSDINSALYVTTELSDYHQVFLAHGNAVNALIAFVTKGEFTVQDIRLEAISPADAALWCDQLYAQLPQRYFPIPCDAFSLLPRTKAALNDGTPWRILMLGDSLVNDTWTSNFQSLVMRDFPKAQLHFSISVRGSTGCWFYRQPENFPAWVASYKPDLVIIGGISNNLNQETYGPAEESLVSVIHQCKALGAEVIVTSPPPSRRWRTSTTPEAWSESFVHEGRLPLERDYQRRATIHTNTPYWDLTTVPCDILSQSTLPPDWYSRDVVHNNDRGKQLIGQNLAAWFRAALL